MTEVNGYQLAVREAERQGGSVAGNVICGACGTRYIGTVWRKPRGLLLVSAVEDMEALGIERILRAHDTGRAYEHLTPPGWTAEQVERLIRYATSQPDYKPRRSRLKPGLRRLTSLIDFLPAGLPDEDYRTSALCSVHGTNRLRLSGIVC